MSGFQQSVKIGEEVFVGVSAPGAPTLAPPPVLPGNEPAYVRLGENAEDAPIENLLVTEGEIRVEIHDGDRESA